MEARSKGVLEAGEAETGMVVERRFTAAGEDPFDLFDWKQWDVKIGHDSIPGTKLPSGFTGNSGNICAQKYFRKAGVPKYLRKVVEEDVPVWLQRSEPDHERLETLDVADRTGGETDGRQLFRRLAGTWTYWGWKYGYFASEVDARAYFDEMCYLIASQRSAPNSPQWFNTGLHWAYGIDGPAQGHSYVDPDTSELTYSTNAYEHPQPHACFIQSVSDSLVGGSDSIMGLWNREALLFKYGSGTGSNFSNIRGAGEPLSGGGTSSGLLSFLKIGDRAAGAIKSGGTTRRAAKMVTLDLDHPDIEDYIEWKAAEEEKVSTLVIGSRILQKHANIILEAIRDYGGEQGCFDKEENHNLKIGLKAALDDHVPWTHLDRILRLAEQGWEMKCTKCDGKGKIGDEACGESYGHGNQRFEIEVFDTDWQGGAYLSVSGQNSNNSIRVPNSFIDAVKEDGDWDLFWRTEKDKAKAEGRSPESCRTVRAQDMWEKIAYAAWSCADPGVQFDTTINEWHTCPEGGRINGSNPCSEYMFLDDTACNLASINLLQYYDLETQTFQIEDFRHSVRLWTTTLEISVLMAQFPSEKIAQLSYDYRTLGLGYCNIGSLLMHMGIPYDDERGYAICGAITSIMCGESYATSAEMASFLGPFADYERNSEHMLRVIRNHRRAAYDLPEGDYEGITVKPKAINAKKCPKDLLDAAREVWDRALRDGEEHGYRNAQTTVIAPTGTIGLTMAADTTGIEPAFSLVQHKKLAGGGDIRITMNGVGSALKRLGYSDNECETIEEYINGTWRLSGCPYLSIDALKSAGFTTKDLGKIESKMEGYSSFYSTFSPMNLGKELCTRLGIPEEDYDEAQKSHNAAKSEDQKGAIEEATCRVILKEIVGLTEDEFRGANKHIFGHMTIEDAPGLKEKHVPIFDCANKGGGRRSLDWSAHVNMMAAAQPFISGAISKTINMPFESGIDDVRDAYNLSHSTMNKACAVYRDDSKLSAPLTAPKAIDEIERASQKETEVKRKMEQEVVSKLRGTVPTQQAVGDTIPLPEDMMASVAKEYVQEYIATRTPLPDSLDANRLKARVGGHTVYLTSSAYDDGRLGEILITTSKEGAAWRSMLNQFAIAVSIGLQHGVPLDAFVKSFTFQKFEPSGMVTGGSGRVKMSTSIVDYIFRELGIKYLDRDELAHITEEDLDRTSISKPEITKEGLMRAEGEKRSMQMTLAAAVAPLNKHHDEIRSTGDVCSECGGSQMQRNGTCLVCRDCGSTTGCS